MFSKELVFILVILLCPLIVSANIQIGYGIPQQRDTEVSITYTNLTTIEETDPYWTANFSNMQSDCPAGNYSYGVYDNGSIKCRSDESQASGSDTQKTTTGFYLYNDTSTIYFNATQMNDTIDLRASSLGDNSSWNETHAIGLFLEEGDEGNLNVNSSAYWDGLDTFNSTQIEDNAGIFNVLESWLTTFWNTVWGTKTTDDLTQGATNYYDNQTWNQTFANTLYSTGVDTNASTECSNAEVLLGNTSCWDANVFFDDTTVSNCSDDQSCANVVYETDFPFENRTSVACENVTGAVSDLCTITAGADGNASSICSDNEVLLGQDGTLCIILNDTIDDRVTGSGDNSSWNETHARDIFVEGIEADLNVNSSGYWDSLDTFNSTQMEDNSGVLNILETWFTTLWNAIFGTKTTDDLTQGATNYYDNQSWNKTYADSLYTGGADNSSWNETHAWSLFAPNSTEGIQYLINDTGVYSTYNATYDTWTNNQTQAVYNEDRYLNKTGGTMTGNVTYGDNIATCYGDAGCADSYIYFNGSDLIFKVN